MRILSSFCLGLVLVSTGHAQSTEQKVEMGAAMLVYLKAPTVAPMLDKKFMSSLQSEHMQFMKELWKKGQVQMGGQLDECHEGKELWLINAKNAEEVKNLLAEDPMLKLGQRTIECFTWFHARNYILKSRKFEQEDVVEYGTLFRSPEAKTLSEEEGNKMQEGHMANIKAMAKEGTLLLAGPMEENTAFRGVFIFKAIDRSKILKLTEPDPTISSGRLILNLFKWHIQKDVILVPQKH